MLPLMLPITRTECPVSGETQLNATPEVCPKLRPTYANAPPLPYVVGVSYPALAYLNSRSKGLGGCQFQHLQRGTSDSNCVSVLQSASIEA